MKIINIKQFFLCKEIIIFNYLNHFYYYWYTVICHTKTIYCTVIYCPWKRDTLLGFLKKTFPGNASPKWNHFSQHYNWLLNLRKGWQYDSQINTHLWHVFPVLVTLSLPAYSSPYSDESLTQASVNGGGGSNTTGSSPTE